jgi:hypothetical protein
MSLALRSHSPTIAPRQPDAFRLTPGEVHRLSPAQVREAVSSLIAQDKMSVAIAICEAALALHPSSEDLLVISSLIAEIQQDWPRAEELLIELVEVQSPNTTAETWLHLARVARCQNHFDDAWVVLDFAATQYPDNAQIRQELASLNAMVESKEPR